VIPWGGVRGDDASYGSFFSYIDLEMRIRADHPLRVIRAIADAALKSLSSKFQKLSSPLGRESIPPERPPGRSPRVSQGAGSINSAAERLSKAVTKRSVL
jgi:hypothetical protein